MQDNFFLASMLLPHSDTTHMLSDFFQFSVAFKPAHGAYMSGKCVCVCVCVLAVDQQQSTVVVV